MTLCIDYSFAFHFFHSLLKPRYSLWNYASKCIPAGSDAGSLLVHLFLILSLWNFIRIASYYHLVMGKLTIPTLYIICETLQQYTLQTASHTNGCNVICFTGICRLLPLSQMYCASIYSCRKCELYFCKRVCNLIIRGPLLLLLYVGKTALINVTSTTYISWTIYWSITSLQNYNR